MESLSRVPLAERMRPKTLNEVIGQTHLLGDNEILKQIVKNREPVSLILWGPPGSGKTTLARVIAKDKTGTSSFELFCLSMKSTASIKPSKMRFCPMLSLASLRLLARLPKTRALKLSTRS